ncbi:nucleotidyltransferase substrate binding protein [Methylobacter tundripaludum]|jgi:nucleotidyltransferase substrate binding protein (TIGR01987 family)|nr:nucleotidyltransferase substrate binding protein [Methylobacter tundripaludum]
MTEDIRWKQRFENYKLALYQLTLAVELSRQRPLSNLEKQGVIQGFEFVHELAWNVLKDYLAYEGIQGIVGSRGAVREAFKRGLIEDGETWMDMIEKRNLSSHTYNLEIAEALIVAIINTYHPEFLALQEDMQHKE